MTHIIPDKRLKYDATAVYYELKNDMQLLGYPVDLLEVELWKIVKRADNDYNCVRDFACWLLLRLIPYVEEFVFLLRLYCRIMRVDAAVAIDELQRQVIYATTLFYYMVQYFMVTGKVPVGESIDIRFNEVSRSAEESIIESIVRLGMKKGGGVPITRKALEEVENGLELLEREGLQDWETETWDEWWDKYVINMDKLPPEMRIRVLIGLWYILKGGYNYELDICWFVRDKNAKKSE